jgi:hypothetical protein
MKVIFADPNKKDEILKRLAFNAAKALIKQEQEERIAEIKSRRE